MMFTEFLGFIYGQPGRRTPQEWWGNFSTEPCPKEVLELPEALANYPIRANTLYIALMALDSSRNFLVGTLGGWQ
jgi:hypothetical protein